MYAIGLWIFSLPLNTQGVRDFKNPPGYHRLYPHRLEVCQLVIIRLMVRKLLSDTSDRMNNSMAGPVHIAAISLSSSSYVYSRFKNATLSYVWLEPASRQLCTNCYVANDWYQTPRLLGSDKSSSLLKKSPKSQREAGTVIMSILRSATLYYSGCMEP